MLENLEPAEKIRPPSNFRPGVVFDGQEGEATTPGLDNEPETFDEYLRDAGIDPEGIEVIPPVRTSRWQQQRDGELIWLTSYRFTFRKRSSSVDLPLILAAARKKYRSRTIKTTQPRALVVLWSDLQVGKVDWLGGAEESIARIEKTRAALVELVKREKPERIVFVDLGDTIEGFDNKQSEHQNRTNDLSIHEQVDMATTFAWETLKALVELVPDVRYASVGSNHCQWRIKGQKVGKTTDDWGVFIGRQLARLAQETNAPIRFLEPQPHHESLALDVFDDGFHVLGIVHGHQAARPEGLPDWWRKQSFGSQPVAAASILLHGHFHHFRLQELGATADGASRYLIGAPTLDNGSAWFRNSSGEQSVPGLATFALEKGEPFSGTVWKL